MYHERTTIVDTCEIPYLRETVAGVSDIICDRIGCGKTISVFRARKGARYCGLTCRQTAAKDRAIERDGGRARATVSIRGEVAERFESWCAARGVSMSAAIEPRILAAIGAAAA